MIELAERFNQYLDTVHLQSGDLYIQEGQTAKTIGFVQSGLLRAYQINHEGEYVTTNFFYKNTFCGSFYSFYQQSPSFESIEALGPVQMYVITYDVLHDLFEKDLLINQIGRKAIEEVCIKKDIRISKLLKLDAKHRYLWFMEEYPEVIQQAPLKHIASYLGMNPETLSRIRRNIIS